MRVSRRFAALFPRRSKAEVMRAASRGGRPVSSSCWSWIIWARSLVIRREAQAACCSALCVAIKQGDHTLAAVDGVAKTGGPRRPQHPGVSTCSVESQRHRAERSALPEGGRKRRGSGSASDVPRLAVTSWSTRNVAGAGLRAVRSAQNGNQSAHDSSTRPIAGPAPRPVRGSTRPAQSLVRSAALPPTRPFLLVLLRARAGRRKSVPSGLLCDRSAETGGTPTHSSVRCQHSGRRSWLCANAAARSHRSTRI
jgi:hypothetical protein